MRPQFSGVLNSVFAEREGEVGDDDEAEGERDLAGADKAERGGAEGADEGGEEKEAFFAGGDVGDGPDERSEEDGAELRGREGRAPPTLGVRIAGGHGLGEVDRVHDRDDDRGEGGVGEVEAAPAEDLSPGDGRCLRRTHAQASDLPRSNASEQRMPREPRRPNDIRRNASRARKTPLASPPFRAILVLECLRPSRPPSRRPCCSACPAP